MWAHLQMSKDILSLLYMEFYIKFSDLLQISASIESALVPPKLINFASLTGKTKR